ncbi:MAG: hypothetical protein J5518_07820 [Lachnospiraceae bacterium]|nr:hypothetical protein [Lachnospiraceae bacterium]
MSERSKQPEEQNQYLNELNTLQEQDAKERLERVEAIFRDKAAATEKIPLLYLRDVTDIAKLYEGQGVLIDDLIGEGNLALLSGCANLDLCETAEEVEEFLTRTIMDAMESLIAEDANASDVDEKIAQRVSEVYAAAKELSETLLKKVSVEELAQEMEVPVSEIEEAIRLSGNRIDYIDTEQTE